MAKTFRRDPDSLLDYKVDFEEWIGTDQIVSATAITDAVASAQVSGLRVASVSISGDAAVIVWLSGGVLDNEYHVAARIWTSAGRKNDECFTIQIEECP